MATSGRAEADERVDLEQIAAGVGAIAQLSSDSGTPLLPDDIASLKGAEVVSPRPRPAPQHLRLFTVSDGSTTPGASEVGIRLQDGTTLVGDRPGSTSPSVQLGPIIRAIIENSQAESPSTASSLETSLPSGWRLLDGPVRSHEFARDLVRRGEEWSRFTDRDFANSAVYMGTKRVLLPFLMTSIGSLDPQPATVVDLMCGSGVVAGAASREYVTFASDAQRFCQLLALIQGGGFDRARAKSVLQTLRPIISSHMETLSGLVEELLIEEDGFLTEASDWPSLASRYAKFVENTPGYPNGGTRGGWNPRVEIDLRRGGNPELAPYCLCTAYFANVFFGIRQAIELDSIRFAIDQLESPWERDWCIGTLVVTTSAIATAYGGHFAQPPARSSQLESGAATREVLSRRHMSALREFEVRLRTLGFESERALHTVQTIPGPWPEALRKIESIADPRSTIVYLDAPYRREEYSRYYHVLETITAYDYPSAVGGSRMPVKGTDRFSSEFFTRSAEKKVDVLVAPIRTILTEGFRCAWSYADRGDVDPARVLDRVGPLCRRVTSRSAEHVFKRQGRSKGPGTVKEFLFLLEPRQHGK